MEPTEENKQPTPLAPGKKNLGGRPPTVAKPAEIDYEKLASMVAAKMAPAFIASHRNETHTSDMKVGQDADIILKDGAVAKGGVSLDAIDKPLHKNYLDDLMFMEELMTIMVNETTDQNAENPIPVGNNGQFVYFQRGQAVKVKRKFVDGLIVKSGRVSTPEYSNPGGERAFKIVQQSAHKYPFVVIEDRNPRGVEWLTRRLSEII